MTDGASASLPADDSRAKQLEDYKEVLSMYITLLEEGDQDEEGQALLVEVQDQLTALATSLNQQEARYLSTTPNVVKVVLPGEDESHPVVLFPASAPYEVLYDQRAWYSCVITHVVAPEESTDRTQYRAWILGYNTEEVVLGDDLRPWQGEDALTSLLTSGAACHGVHPLTGRFAPAVVERLTLEGTVIVRWRHEGESAIGSAATPVDEKEPSATQTSELPLSHVRVGKQYAVLVKHNLVTEEDKQQRRRANAQRKRERVELGRQLKSDKVEQDANDWKTMMDDLAEVPDKKKRRRR